MRTVAVLAGLLAGAVLVLTACGGGDNPGVSEGGDLGHGRDMFIQAGCGSCHTMEAAGPQAVGTTGPNLDTAFAASREQGLAELVPLVGELRYYRRFLDEVSAIEDLS